MDTSTFFIDNPDIRKKMKNYYELLGVSTFSTENEIKQAYRKLSLKLHPDTNGNDPYYENMFKTINEAYSTLIDKEKRKEYDDRISSKSKPNSETHQYKSNEIFDEMCPRAVALILAYNNSSAPFIQRKLLLGYNRTITLIDQLISLGILKKGNDSILVNQQQAIELLKQKIENFSKSEFIETYNQYKIDNQEVINRQKKTFERKTRFASDWKEINTLTIIRNIILTLNVLLVIYIYVLPKNSIDFSNLKRLLRPTKVNHLKVLNIYTRPSFKAKIIASVPFNERVYILDKQGPKDSILHKTANWINVEYKNKKGWTWGGFLEIK